ncbi:MAG: hypothetical protein ABR512_14700, partial [Desulfopila sp.]
MQRVRQLFRGLTRLSGAAANGIPKTKATCRFDRFREAARAAPLFWLYPAKPFFRDRQFLSATTKRSYFPAGQDNLSAAQFIHHRPRLSPAGCNSAPRLRDLPAGPVPSGPGWQGS